MKKCPLPSTEEEILASVRSKENVNENNDDDGEDDQMEIQPVVQPKYEEFGELGEHTPPYSKLYHRGRDKQTNKHSALF